MITACHSCKYNGKGDPRCIRCRRVSQDDIRISRTPHAKSEMVAATPPREEKPTPCTALDEANEQRLRIAMATLFGLTPIQLLCVQHLMRGGRLSNFFEDTLAPIHKRIGEYRGSERSQAGMMRDAIATRAPFLAPVLASLVKREGYDAAHRHPSIIPISFTPAPEATPEATEATPATDATPEATDEALTEAHLAKLMDEPQGDLFQNVGIILPFDNLRRKTRR